MISTFGEALPKSVNNPNKSETAPEVPGVDMGSYILEIPPIEGVFNPVLELQKIPELIRESREKQKKILLLMTNGRDEKDLTENENEQINLIKNNFREEREKLLTEYKSKLNRQRKAWAVCRLEVEKRIETKPELFKDMEMAKKEFYEIIDGFAKVYGFDQEYLNIAKSIIDEFLEKKQNILSLREQYPNDLDFLNKLLETRLGGKKLNDADLKDIRVLTGPYSVEIYVDNPNLFLLLLLGKESDSGGRGKNTAGFATDTLVLNNLGTGDVKLPIIVVNEYYKSSPEFYSSILTHEREHNKNRNILYRDSFFKFISDSEVAELDFTKVTDYPFFEYYLLTPDQDKKEVMLREYLRFKLESTLVRAKDEILAMETDTLSLRKNHQILSIFLSFSSDNPYDYLNEYRDIPDLKFDTRYPRLCKEILVEKYSLILVSALESFSELIGMGIPRERESNYTFYRRAFESMAKCI